LIHVTRDGGKTWTNVTPLELTAWSKVSIIDAGRFAADTAYAAINRIRLDDQRPHIYRTHDGGKTWKEIVRGLPDNAPVNAVREDPVRRGLLFCGTERAVFVSFNDGDDWQPLRLNMPATSIRDLVVHEDDVVVGTHGRSFWILDDITPLRQITAQTAAADAFLFKPQTAYRVRWNQNTDTPLPQEEPAGQNPPDGAIINYTLKAAVSGPVALEIFDSANNLVRRFSSADKPDAIAAIVKEVNIPPYWIRPSQPLSTAAGMQRFVWDMHYAPPVVDRYEYPIAAIYGDTPRHPLGPWVMPGDYTVKLTVGGKSYTQPLKVAMDPRVKTTPAELANQFALSQQVYNGARQTRVGIEQVRKLRAHLKSLRERAGQGAMADAIQAFDQKAAAIEGSGGGPRGGGGGGEMNLARMNGTLLALLALLQEADAPPTTQAVAAVKQTEQPLAAILLRWNEFKSKDVKAFNEQLRQANLPPIPEL
jgi:hypothetical protein